MPECDVWQAQQWTEKKADRDKRVNPHSDKKSPQITSEANSHLRNPISARTVQRELHASNLYGRVGIQTIGNSTSCFTATPVV
ncbi:hypothetical protein TNCV_4687621 [Trichonephila clavipes]|nr:hypothetical protein TNCV_4687621 [Trichonephila clavipes]